MKPIANWVGMIAILLTLIASPSFASQRIALVIGNGEYNAIGALPNPPRDAVLMAGRLEAVGFEVIEVVNADQASLKRAIAAFGRRLRNAGQDAVGLFYYAGHGVQSFGANYLLPVDTNLEDAADLPLVGVDAESVLQQMYSARNATNIVILDACRNNPFEAIREFTDNGLAEMRAPTGTFLAYATAPGSVALDGEGENSPFTEALAEHIVTPGLAVEQVFKQVRIAVLEKTQGLQTPWDTSSLTSDFLFVADTSADKPAERDLVEAARASGTVEAYLEYLRYYPDGLFAEFARAEIAARSKTPEVQETGTGGEVVFNQPLATGDPAIAGQSLEQLIAGSPLYPPIEGLPEELWMGQPCSNCHQWTKEDLCAQANVYLDAGLDRALSKDHPLGSGFKTALHDWAGAGCP